MKYLLIFISVVLPSIFFSQENPAPPGTMGKEGVIKNLTLAQEFYQKEDYRKAKETASLVLGEAAAMGMDNEFRKAQKLVIHCEYVLGLEKSREKSEGVSKAAIAIQLSDAFFKNGEFEKAAKLAAQAYQEAAASNDKSLMATAMNKEALASMKNKEASSTEKAEAKQKFKTSLKMMAENKVINPILKKDNLEHIEDWGKVVFNSAEIADAKEAVRFVLDSINSNLGKITGEDFSFVFAGKNQHPPVPPPPGEEPQEHKNERKEKRQELFHKIISMDRDRMAKELVEPLPPPPPGTPEATVWVEHLTNEMKELWPAKMKVIESEFQEKEKRIEKMAPNEIREELLLATYKNRYDSLLHLHILDSINLEKQELAIKQHEAEMERQKIRRSLMMTGSGSTLLLAVFLLFGFTRQKKNNRLLSEKNEEINKEKERSDELLLNILPAQVAGELKAFGEAKARHYDNVTVLFSDFKDFSKIAENLPPGKLVKELDYCFKAFDEIVSRNGLEKIKTIGDAYMCAGGLPDPGGDHAARAVRAAMEMQQFLDEWKKEKMQLEEPYFEARIGIHTGPVVAGVVGVKKFAYDIWGDTVNIASRMESSGEPGKINISGKTRQLLGDAFQCSYRGKIQAKNKGEIDMYFVEG